MYCTKVKEYLSQKGIRYVERNVSTDRTAMNDLRSMGIMTLPLTMIDGEAVTGFNQEKFDALLNK
jgi:glutaredoxin 3